MPGMRLRFASACFLAALILLAGGLGHAADPSRVRVGYAPYATHLTAITGFSPQKRSFYKAFPKTRFDNRLFLQDSAALAALKKGEIDIVFVGATATVDARMRGEDIIVIARAANGGAILLSRVGSGVMWMSDFDGKRVAVPEAKSVEDVLLRYQLALNARRPVDRGGKVTLKPVVPTNELAAFQHATVDVACLPEPLGSVLERRSKATALLGSAGLYNSGDYASVVVVARRDYAKKNPEFLRAFRTAAKHITLDIAAHRDSYAPLFASEFERLAGQKLTLAESLAALKRTGFRSEIKTHDLQLLVNLLVVAGYHTKAQRLDGIIWP